MGTGIPGLGPRGQYQEKQKARSDQRAPRVEPGHVLGRESMHHDRLGSRESPQSVRTVGQGRRKDPSPQMRAKSSAVTGQRRESAASIADDDKNNHEPDLFCDCQDFSGSVEPAHAPSHWAASSQLSLAAVRPRTRQDAWLTALVHLPLRQCATSGKPRPSISPSTHTDTHSTAVQRYSGDWTRLRLCTLYCAI